mgnify:CR=1 FL=1
MPSIYINEFCVSCTQSVHYGSGRYVNRIPADGEWTVETSSGIKAIVFVDGFMCEECYAHECILCGEKCIDGSEVVVQHPTHGSIYTHDVCMPHYWTQFVYPKE